MANKLLFERCLFTQKLIQNMNIKNKNRLSKKEKIFFSNIYFSKKPYIDTSKIYRYSEKTNQFNELKSFLQISLGYNTSKETKKWFNIYKPKEVSILNYQNERIKITEKKVNEICKLLKAANIPLVNCIVNQALQSYANNDLNFFISNLSLQQKIFER